MNMALDQMLFSTVTVKARRLQNFTSNQISNQILRENKEIYRQVGHQKMRISHILSLTKLPEFVLHH